MRIYHQGNGPGGDEVDEGSEGGVFFVQEISYRRLFPEESPFQKPRV